MGTTSRASNTLRPADEDIVLSHQVLNHVQCQRNLRVVLVVDTKHHRRAVLCSTDVDLDALTIYRYWQYFGHVLSERGSQLRPRTGYMW